GGLCRTQFDRMRRDLDQAALAFAAYAEARAQGADAALWGMHDEGPLRRIGCRLDEDFAVVQAYLAQGRAIENVQGAVGVDLQPPAIGQVHMAPLALVGTVLRQP